MINCPKCGASITNLLYSAKVTTLCLLSADGFYEDVSFEDDCGKDGEDCEFACPECLVTLFTEEEDALKFLNP